MSQRSTLGVGIVGAGFIGNFHVESFKGVRDGNIVAVASRRLSSAQTLAAHAEDIGVGTDVSAYDDVAELVRDPRVDAVWVLTPNFTRIEIVKAIADEVTSGRAQLKGIAIEKPLGRTVAEAREVLELVEGAGLLHGYLENQVFSPGVTRSHELLWSRGAPLAGTPYLARAAEEHAGPHNTWFWNGVEEGGGVLNDMMCHSVEAGRYLLTPPGTEKSEWLKPVAVTATIGSLKWGRPRYAQQLAEMYPGVVDYTKSPSEDYAHAVFEFENGDGEPVIVEGTTSWSFVGAGLRLTFELLGPEYSMKTDTLSTESQIFLSRALQQEEGEDMVEKQNAEQGLMPIVSNEAMAYGYTTENSVFATAFLKGEQPAENLRDGLEVVRLLMAAYKSAEIGETVREFDALEDFVPAVAKGEWNPRA